MLDKHLGLSWELAEWWGEDLQTHGWINNLTAACRAAAFLTWAVCRVTVFVPLKYFSDLKLYEVVGLLAFFFPLIVLEYYPVKLFSHLVQVLQLCSITQHNRASKYSEPTTCKVTMGWHTTYPNQLAFFRNKWHLQAKVGNISWLMYSPEKKTECCRNLCSADLSNFCSSICYLYTTYWTWP